MAVHDVHAGSTVLLAPRLYCGACSSILAVVCQPAPYVATINANSGIGDGTDQIPDFLELCVGGRFFSKALPELGFQSPAQQLREHGAITISNR